MATNDIALVTGGNKGLGLEIVRQLAERGMTVYLGARDETRGREAAAALAGSGGEVRFVSLDVTVPQSVSTAVDTIEAECGGLDVLVNNAGIGGPTGRVEEIHPEDWDRCVAVCLTGQFNCARLAVPHLRQSKNASIVNLSSAAGKFGFSLRTPYAAAKWGVIGFTKSLSIELGGDGIRVNAILPGIVAGDRQRRVLEAKAQQLGLSYADMEKRAFSFTSIKDYITAEQLADQIVFIASPRGRTISGQAISVDGDTGMLS
jgi:NAD(P)-dependent dehydrogenase (short-subunit alcohol dehydrogenase family)